MPISPPGHTSVIITYVAPIVKRQERGVGPMKITAIETYYFDCPLKKEFHPSWIPGHAQTANRCLIFKLVTDAGLEGIAGASVFSEDQARLAKFIAVDTIGRFLIGMDPADLDVLNRVISLYGFMLGGRPWFIETALWDLLGKAAGQPLYRHWGGTPYGRSGSGRT